MGIMTTADLDPNTSAGGDGWARRRERISRHIERTTLELIASYGPENVTVEQMANAAGISVRTFFRYFPTREDIMSALPRRQNHDLFIRVMARPPSERLLDSFIAAVREVPDDPVDQDLLLWGRARRHWPVEAPAPWMITSYREVIAGRIGAPVDDPRVEVMATAIGNVMWLAFIRWLQAEGARPLSAFVEESFTVLSQLNEEASRPTPLERVPLKRRRS
jgi:AcrR family transcriptional regulator